MHIAGYYAEVEVDLIGLEEIPGTATFVAAVKGSQVDATALAMLSSAAGSIVRVSSVLEATGTHAGKWRTRLRFKFADGLSSAWGGQTVFLDAVRTDMPPPEHLGFLVSIAWSRAVTHRALVT